MILLINGLFAQSLRYAQKIILGISNIYLWLFFSHALILNENPHKSTGSSMYTFKKIEHLDVPLTVAYQIASGIEKYHEFIHGMNPVHVLSKGEDFITVVLNSQTLGGKLQMTAQFEENMSIHFKQDKGPFKELSGHWHFSNDGEGVSVTFSMVMNHKRFLLNKALQLLGNKLCNQVIKDFKKQVEGIIKRSAINHQLSEKTNS
jgi:ribosome-associated toxin RatA of RatAB toxin-antitoxin module